MNALAVGVVRETAAGEQRVALTPDVVARLQAIGLEVTVESGAGAAAWFPDAAYTSAGARVVDTRTLYAGCDVLLCVHPPDRIDLLRAGQVVIGLLQPLTSPQLVRDLAAAKVTAISLDGLPRTLSRAQAMDAATSQANVAGYKAALVAADAYSGYFPMLMTAAGTVRPATVLVVGAGVAGLQAIGTARRLGAIVTGYDVRDAARADVLSTGAAFLDLGPGVSAAGAGGYARELTDAERQAQQEAMNTAAGRFDVVITTAQVPGRRPPVLISRAALAAMQPGSVVLDLASSPLGGNVEGSVPGSTVVTGSGVTLIGAGDLPAAVPRAASTAYARNIAALLAHLIHDGQLHLETGDEITAGVLVTHDGEVIHPAVLGQLAATTQGDSR
jgi:NAD(P) transhydrogenase subunit alpha